MNSVMTALAGSLTRGFANAFVLRSPHRKRYFAIGAAALVVLAMGLAAGFSARLALPKPASFAWSVSTGLILLGCILYQWLLFFARLTRRAADVRRHWQSHRYVGAAAVVLFVLHAGAIGYAMISVLALSFLVVAVTGLFNTEVLILRKPWMRQAWEIGHVGVSGILMPLIGLHVWAALAFK